jgi:rSAM/selenodomain-associated transferase 2
VEFSRVTLRQLAFYSDVELIVVDAGSTDQTVEVARRFTPYVFVTLGSCADQMNFGALHATGDILLFLRADSFLMPGALEEIQRRMINDGAVGGAFDLNIDSPRRLCRWVSRITNQPARALKLPGGDQGIFVWRQVFEVLGGFPKMPIMEDVAFACRLRRAGRVTFIHRGLISSDRRANATRVLKTALLNWWLTMLYFLRVPPRQLRRMHDGWRVAGQVPRARTDPIPSPRRSLQERPSE